MRDMFYFLAEKNVLNYADDTTPFATGETWEQVGYLLEGYLKLILLNLETTHLVETSVVVRVP